MTVEQVRSQKFKVYGGKILNKQIYMIKMSNFDNFVMILSIQRF